MNDVLGEAGEGKFLGHRVAALRAPQEIVLTSLCRGEASRGDLLATQVLGIVLQEMLTRERELPQRIGEHPPVNAQGKALLGHASPFEHARRSVGKTNEVLVEPIRSRYRFMFKRGLVIDLFSGSQIFAEFLVRNSQGGICHLDNVSDACETMHMMLAVSESTPYFFSSSSISLFEICFLFHARYT